MQPPNDRRNFVHRRVIGAVGGFLGGGIPGAASGFVRGGGGQPRAVSLRPALPRTRQLRLCDDGRPVGPDGHCHGPVAQAFFHPIQTGTSIASSLVGPSRPQAAAVGSAVMGRFGAGLQPFIETSTRRNCLPGMVLGKDGLCYNKSDISNKNREHPKGRRPLGTPGELAALSKAASFGRRMESTVKRMQKIGVLKKPRRGAPRARPAQRQIGPGPSIINVE